jgi:hypothetical protein
MGESRWRWVGLGLASALVLAAFALALAHPDAASAWLVALPDALCAVVALALVAAGLWVLYLALVRADAGDFAFRRHTGGFGGSSTGWQASPALVRLASGLALIVLALAVTMARLPLKEDPKADAAAGGEGRAAAAEAKAKAASAAASITSTATSAK